MSDTTISKEGAKPAVRLQRLLADPPEVVWRALTEREELRRWFPSDVIVEGGEWVAGAAISFPFPPEVIDLTLEGQVLLVDEPKLLAFTWGEETLRFELSPEGGGTLLVLVDALPAAHAARNAAGWDDCLDQLAGGESNPGGWRARFDAYVVAFEPTLGPQEGPPEGYRGAAS